MASSRRYVVSLGARSIEVEIRREGDRMNVLVEGESIEAQLSLPDAAGLRRLRLDGRAHELLFTSGDGHCRFAIEGVSFDVAVQDELAVRLASLGGGRSRQAGGAVVSAPMPGLVVRVAVEIGQRVEAGEVCVVLQAMKMENELGAPAAGVVKRIAVQAGQAVEQGQALVEVE